MNNARASYLYRKMLDFKEFVSARKEFPYLSVLRSGSVYLGAASSGILEDPFQIRLTEKIWTFCGASYELKDHFENLDSQHSRQFDFPPFFAFQTENPECLVAGEPNAEQISAVDYISEIVSRPEYIATVNRIKAHILRGDIYELNYCIGFYSENVKLDPAALFLNLLQRSDAPFASFVKFRDSYLIGSSPERFLKKEGTTLTSQPIKGTARRGKDDNEDRELAEALLSSNKEKTENVMITDLVRNDLSRIAVKGSVNVDELFGLYSFRQVHQLISTVSCELRSGLSFGDILESTFPMGSMTGAPKVRAMQLIDAYEDSRRELYSGTVGYVDPDGNMDLSVVIRSICYNQRTGYLSFHVGSAITAASDPEKEYEECLVKARAMMEVLGIDFRKFA